MLKRYLSVVFAVLLAFGMLAAGLLWLSNSVYAQYTTKNTVHDNDCGFLAGVISTDTELPEGCDYIVTGNLLVPGGITLTINPGVRLRFDGLYYLKVEGQIIAIGVDGQRILFTSNKPIPVPGDWVGVHLMGFSRSVMSYTTLEYAGGPGMIPGALNVQNGPHVIDYAILRKNQRYPLVIGDGSQLVRHSILRDHNVSGELVSIEGGTGSTLFLSNTLINNVASRIVVVTKDGVPQIIQGNHFEDNRAGAGGIVYVESANQVHIENNAFLSNTVGGSWGGIIQVESTNSTTVRCNLFLGNDATYTGLDPSGIIAIRVPYCTDCIIVNYNNILSNLGEYDMVVRGSTDPLDALNNYWGTIDAVDISERIYDYYDDFNLPQVLFTPYEVFPVLCALTLPPNASFDDSAPDWLGQNTIFTNTTIIIPDDPSITYLWSFGDGMTSTQINPTHTYSQAGLYTAVLTATNAAGTDVATDILTIYGSPTTRFTAYPTFGFYPLTVTFSQTATTTPPDDPTLDYLWNFGDGITSTLPNPMHIYIEEGQYTITLKVTNAAGNNSIVRKNYINIYEPVKAAAILHPREGVVPLTVYFTDTSSGPVTAWEWTFGDGETSMLQHPTHTYTNPGMYTVSLAVMANAESAILPGGSDIVVLTHHITVSSSRYRVYLPLVLRN